jgi:hypothetical protein
MLKLTLTNPNNQTTETYDVVTEFSRMFARAQELELMRSVFGLRVKDMRDPNAPVWLHSDSDVGNGLLRLIPDTHSLYDVQTVDEAVSSVHEDLRDDIEGNLLYEQYNNIEEMFADIKEMLKFIANTKVSFYCPLKCGINDHDGDFYDISNYTLNKYADEIEDAVAKEQSTEINMAEYVGDHAGIKGKLVFIEWGVEERQGVLYGKIDCYLTEPLTPDETERLRDAIEGQNSDGFGEGFEQREIRVDDGDIYVSYWHSGDDYFLYTAEEMHAAKNGGR